MSGQWHYQQGEQSRGPVTGAELKGLAAAGTLLPTDLVWKDGMDKWVPARSLKGLFPPGCAATAVPVPTTPTSAEAVRPGPPTLPPPLPDDEENDDEDRSRAKTRPSRRTLLIAGGSVAGLVAVTLAVLMLFGGKGSSGSNTGGATSPNAPGRDDRPNPRFANAAKTALAMFAEVDYSKGPAGEVLEFKEIEDSEYKVKAQGFYQGKKFINHGFVSVWFPDGEKESEAYWFNGKRHGSISVWHRSRGLKWKGYNRNGVIDGYYVEFFDNGSLKTEGVYQNGRKEGIFISYYRSGNEMRESEYETRKEIGLMMKAEQWFDAKGEKTDGPTLSALTKRDFMEVLEYRLKYDPTPFIRLVQGSITPPDEKFGRTQYELTVANFDFDYYMRFIGLPESGFSPDFVKQADQDWIYTFMDGPLRIRVTCGRPIANKEGFILGKAERVIINKLVH